MASTTSTTTETTNLRYTVNSDKVKYSSSDITTDYEYSHSRVNKDKDGKFVVTPMTTSYTFKTQLKVPKVGMLLVGWGGNNGTTLTGSILANKHKLTWETRTGKHSPDYYGSVCMSSTVSLGTTSTGEDVFIPLCDMLPMAHPNDLVIGGWDISKMNLSDALDRAEVLDFDLKRQLKPMMKDMKPMPSIYYPDFIASNQEARADNVMPGKDKQKHLEQVRSDIANFKKNNKLDKVIVLWTANTERFVDERAGLNDTAENLLKAIENSEDEVSPSNIFAVASILEGCAFINGSPQNTLVKGVIELARQKHTYIGGSDFKSGQTKIKSVLVDFLVSSGIKPVSIVSYNHLGNNDGKNLNAPKQFRSKEISKSNVVDDMVESNPILYKPQEHPDHCVVIKYVPYVGDSKRAMDEYTSEIFMGGKNTLVMHNTCEDSLLAAPLILDLVLLTELMERVQWKSGDMKEFETFESILTILSFLLKAPLVPKNTPIINALFKQRACIENILRAFVGLPPHNHMLLSQKTKGGSD